jgi:hypothetical protein
MRLGLLIEPQRLGGGTPPEASADDAARFPTGQCAARRCSLPLSCRATGEALVNLSEHQLNGRVEREMQIDMKRPQHYCTDAHDFQV